MVHHVSKGHKCVAIFLQGGGKGGEGEGGRMGNKIGKDGVRVEKHGVLRYIETRFHKHLISKNTQNDR
jgi:hypothetical protein